VALKGYAPGSAQLAQLNLDNALSLLGLDNAQATDVSCAHLPDQVRHVGARVAVRLGDDLGEIALRQRRAHRPCRIDRNRLKSKQLHHTCQAVTVTGGIGAAWASRCNPIVAALTHDSLERGPRVAGAARRDAKTPAADSRLSWGCKGIAKLSLECALRPRSSIWRRAAPQGSGM